MSSSYEMAKQITDGSSFGNDYYGVKPQGPEESDGDFVARVVGELRAKGHVVEAHEVNAGRRFDDPDGAQTVFDGLAGAMALALSGDGAARSVSGDPYRRVGDEVAAGAVALSPKTDPNFALLAIMLGLRS